MLKFCCRRPAVRPPGGRGGAPCKLSSGCHLFPARFLVFCFSSEACSLVARNIVRTCHFLVGRPFSCSATGRLSLRWVGPKPASLQLAPVRAAPVRAACCRVLRVRRAWRSLFFIFIPSHACRLSGQPFFSACFRLFPTSTRKFVCVCVCFAHPHPTRAIRYYRRRNK